jgi:hypothetical protein
MKLYDIEIMKTPDGYMAYDKIDDDYLTDSDGNNLFNTYQEAQELKDLVLFDFGTDEDNGMGLTTKHEAKNVRN